MTCCRWIPNFFVLSFVDLVTPYAEILEKEFFLSERFTWSDVQAMAVGERDWHVEYLMMVKGKQEEVVNRAQSELGRISSPTQPVQSRFPWSFGSGRKR